MRMAPFGFCSSASARRPSAATDHCRLITPASIQAVLPACAASCIEKTRAGDDDEWEVKQLARRLERLVDGAEGEDDE